MVGLKWHFVLGNWHVHKINVWWGIGSFEVEMQARWSIQFNDIALLKLKLPQYTESRFDLTVTHLTDRVTQ